MGLELFVSIPAEASCTAISLVITIQKLTFEMRQLTAFRLTTANRLLTTFLRLDLSPARIDIRVCAKQITREAQGVELGANEHDHGNDV